MAATNDDELAIPVEMRAYAATTVDQARKAFHDFVTTAERTIATLDSRSAEAAEVRRNMLGAAEAHVAAAFDLAERMVKAATVEEIVALQQAFLAGRLRAADGGGTGGGPTDA
jgi:hypothetical protein